MKNLFLFALLFSQSSFAMCGSDALEAAENFAVHVRHGQVGQLEIVKESSNDLVYTYVIENTIAGPGGYTEVYEVVADLDSQCMVDKVTFLHFK